MIQIGCKKHPRYQAKTDHMPMKCDACHDLWALKREIQGHNRSDAPITLFPEELKVAP